VNTIASDNDFNGRYENIELIKAGEKERRRGG
jgi:hypothetical protein